MEHLHTTICALATPPGEGGIATVRVSGPDAYGIVGKIFAPVRQGKSVADAKGYTAMLGHYLLHGAEMDECVALFFRAPHSYTGEDVIELSVHGGTAMADGLLAGGAKAVMGYVNNVYSVYSRSMLWAAVNRMIEGETLEQAVDYAKSIYGTDDIIWYNEQGGRRSHAAASYAMLSGDRSAALPNPYTAADVDAAA